MIETLEINPFQRTEAQIIEQVCGYPWDIEDWRVETGATPGAKSAGELRAFEEEFHARRFVLISRMKLRRLERFCNQLGVHNLALLLGLCVRNTDPEYLPGQRGWIEKVHVERELRLDLCMYSESGIGVLINWGNKPIHSSWFDSAFIEALP